MITILFKEYREKSDGSLQVHGPALAEDFSAGCQISIERMCLEFRTCPGVCKSHKKKRISYLSEIIIILRKILRTNLFSCSSTFMLPFNFKLPNYVRNSKRILLALKLNNIMG